MLLLSMKLDKYNNTYHFPYYTSYQPSTNISPWAFGPLTDIGADTGCNKGKGMD